MNIGEFRVILVNLANVHDLHCFAVSGKSHVEAWPRLYCFFWSTFRANKSMLYPGIDLTDLHMAVLGLATLHDKICDSNIICVVQVSHST